MTRSDILATYAAKVATGAPIIGAGAGIGLSARCAESAGADFLVIYNSGRYRMAGRGSTAGLMPYGDANAIVVDMGREVLPVVETTPVLAGVCGSDPFRLMPVFLRELKNMGFAGVQNYPTVCLFEGMVRANLEETGMGFDREVAMIHEAHRQDLVTATYVATRAEAEEMTKAGADILVPHMGLTTSGSIGAQTAISLDESVERVREMQAAIRQINPESLVLCHGGPIAGPDDVAYLFERVPGLAGFLGASSMERLPTEVAMTTHIERFTQLRPSPNLS
ncbi:phosphoenolpyruvate hydrolase family protein [Sciscionella marina]|uniref:phosphoenolpyruvate hydrolase family protein n=1 Tax=Sciscionella marina TaxID=508770 RepID=UPI00037581EE|nr:phosphoenolpyruvate hydrolase family protein [Sciscionella marina]